MRMRPVKSSVIAAATQSRRMRLVPTPDIETPFGPKDGSRPTKYDSLSIAHLNTA